MSDALRALGAQAILFPTIEIAAPPDENLIRRAIENLSSYQWLLFTSINAVNRFFYYLNQDFDTASNFPQIAVVGPATAKAVEAYGATVSLMAEAFQQEGILDVFASLPHAQTSPTRVLLPRALEARDVLEKHLPQLGYELTVVPVYQTICAQRTAEEVSSVAGADGIVFTSPSTLRNFIKIMDDHSKESALRFLQNIDIFSIGPITTGELHKISALRDYSRLYEAHESTGKSLIRLISVTYA